MSPELQSKFSGLQHAARELPYPSLELRRDRLRRAIDVLIANETRIVAALDADFGGRAEALTLLTDVLSPVRSLRHALRHVKRWMRSESRRPEFPMGLIGARASVFYQPLGVVGVVAPWNAPVALAFSPLASVLAAGNLAFIKPSELAPASAELIAELIRSVFAETEVTTVLGGPEVARAFTALPFNHLIFTGGTETARAVMRAAAEHLVPVTLELGGKSPALIAPGTDLAYAAAKIANGKFVNAGQVCMAPDFALVHQRDKERFVNEVRSAVHRLYPGLQRNADYTRVHLPRQRLRLATLVSEAQQRGATVEILTDDPVIDLTQLQRFPPVLVVDPPLDSELMRAEVFGPVLPIVSYESLEQAVSLLAGLSRPLALYFIGGSAADKQYILKNTYAGGVTFDDVMLHPFMQDLAFGGVGHSGMGRYLGYDGFKALSNAKGVVQRPWFDITRFLAPPYSPNLSRAMRYALRF